MEAVIRSIKDRIAECKSSGRMFMMPDIDGCLVSKQELPCNGSTTSHCSFAIVLPDGRSVYIDYQSKDESQAFSIVPERSYIRVECPNHSDDFSDSWEEKL